MLFTVELRQPTGTFEVDLGGVFMYRWTGTEWIVVGEIKIFN